MDDIELFIWFNEHEYLSAIEQAKYWKVSTAAIRKWKKKLNIKPKSSPFPKRKGIARGNVSTNPCCNKDWLMLNYATRDQYIEFCEQNSLEIKEDGGKGLSIIKCAKLANVCNDTICRWLSNFDIATRTLCEAVAGELNPFYGKKHSEKTKELISKKLSGTQTSKNRSRSKKSSPNRTYKTR